MTETVHEWVDTCFTDWDAAIDLTAFFEVSTEVPCAYHVKAIVQHVHGGEGPVTLTSGHYIAALRQEQGWHLADDSRVQRCTMGVLKGAPYMLVLERADIPGISLQHAVGSDALAEADALLARSAATLHVSHSPISEDATDSSSSSCQEQQAEESEIKPASSSLEVCGPAAHTERGGKRAGPSEPEVRGLAKYFKLTASTSSGAPATAISSQQNSGRDRTGRDFTNRDQSSRDQGIRDQTGKASGWEGRGAPKAHRSGAGKHPADRAASKRADQRRRLSAKAARDCEVDRSDPLDTQHTPVMLFVDRMTLPPRAGPDDCLRTFPDEPEPMPPISCLLKGCEHVWLNSKEQFLEHCDQKHEGYQAYRLRVIHLLSAQVFQIPGSLQRSALQNFAEFQCRSETAWHRFTPAMRQELASGNALSQSDRWTPRTWTACCVCATQDWSENMCFQIAGAKCCFESPLAVAQLLDPERYIKMWPEVPASEVRASSVTLQFVIGGQKCLTGQRLLLHKRRVTTQAACGEETAALCLGCFKSLRKTNPEMPVDALANGRWLGRHPECMRSMPFGHRLLLPTRRVVMTKVVFTANPKNPRERSHSNKGLDGLTMVVEQAAAAKCVLEYPPSDLGESFEALLVGVDPDDRRRAQCFPINKELFLVQRDFLQKFSAPNRAAFFNKELVDGWTTGETPALISAKFADVPVVEQEEVDMEEIGKISRASRCYRCSCRFGREPGEPSLDISVPRHGGIASGNVLAGCSAKAAALADRSRSNQKRRAFSRANSGQSPSHSLAANSQRV